MSNYIRIGGFFSNPEVFPKQRFDIKSIVAPQVLSVGGLPSKNDVKEEVAEEGTIKHSNVLLDTIADQFYATGLISQREPLRTYQDKLFYPDLLSKASIYLQAKVQSLNIPNIGNFLGGSMLSNSYLLREGNSFSGANSLTDLGPHFSLIHVFYDKSNKKGIILKSDPSLPVIRQKYVVKKRIDGSDIGRKTSSNINISKSELIFSGNFLNTMRSLKSNFILRTYKIDGSISSPINFEEFRDDLTEEKTIDVHTFDTPNKFIDYCRKITDNEDESKHFEKILSKTTQNFDRIDYINSTYLVYNPSYLCDYINMLVLMIMQEIKEQIRSSIENIDYVIYEYFLNKLYYAVITGDDSFEAFNIRYNGLIDNNKTRRQTNDILKEKFKNSRTNLDFSSNFWNQGKSIETKVDERDILDDYKNLYMSLTTDSINTLLKLIYNASVGIREVQNLNFSVTEDSSVASITFDRVIDDALI